MSFATSNLGLSDLQTNLGGSNPIALSEYYSDVSPGYAIGVLSIPTQSNSLGIGNFTGKTIPTTVTLSNSGGALTNHVVNFTLSYKSSYSNNFQDLRFYNESNNTLLSHWYETVSNNTSANVWLAIPSLPNGTRIKVSTGNTSSTGNPLTVFPLYEDFSSFDTTTKWNASSASYTAASNNFTFTSTGFTYIATRSNYPGNIVVEASINSSSATGIPELISRANIAGNTGIKCRGDCRVATNGGVGSFLNSPFNAWNILYQPNNFPFPSNGTNQVMRFSASSSNFICFYNGTSTTTHTNTAADLNNTSGVIAFANHNGTPIRCQWLRAYPSTSNTITVTVV